LIIEDGHTCTYVSMLNEKGEMMTAVSDMALVDKLSPVHVIKHNIFLGNNFFRSIFSQDN